jgi:hypothetical protein
MRTLLALAQEFCRRQALPIPQTVVNAQDDQTLQIWGLLNEGQSDLVERGDWQQLRTTTPAFIHRGFDYGNLIAGGSAGAYVATYISEAATSSSSTLPAVGGIGGATPYGSGYIVCPGIKSIIPETFFCNSTRLPVTGPVTTAEWAYVLALSVQPAQYIWRMEGNAILIYPFADSSILFSFKYQSRFPVYTTYDIASTIPEPKYDSFYGDTDASLLPDKIVLQDLKWRWRSTKGMPYAEEQRICEEMITDALSSNQPAPDITMDSPHSSKVAGPGLLVAAGNWPV